MTEREPSKTALGVALLRAVHQLLDESPKILDDYVAVRLFDPARLDGIRAAPQRFRTRESRYFRAHILMRSRYAEDRLARAVGRGVRQYVSLGAGYDTFAYRQPEWARGLRIFEVDQPATQREKRARLEAAGIQPPANVEFVPIDFERTSLAEGLLASGFDPAQPAFFSWLGVMMYLEQAAIDAVFRFVAACPRGSELVFTFAPPERTDPEGKRHTATMAERAARRGEPWKTRAAWPDLARQLQGHGFSEITCPTSAELRGWYIDGRSDGLQISDRRTLASAVV
jgi:methyltransferase (TIGR00027 family)